MSTQAPARPYLAGGSRLRLLLLLRLLHRPHCLGKPPLRILPPNLRPLRRSTTTPLRLLPPRLPLPLLLHPPRSRLLAAPPTPLLLPLFALGLFLALLFTALRLRTLAGGGREGDLLGAVEAVGGGSGALEDARRGAAAGSLVLWSCGYSECTVKQGCVSGSPGVGHTAALHMCEYTCAMAPCPASVNPASVIPQPHPLPPPTSPSL